MAMTIEKAVLYEKYRLPYAERAVTDLLDYIGAVQVVADIGAGTGQLARLFAQKCTRVYAVEPDPAMRQVASTALANWANVELRDGCGEQSTLAECSLDLIVVGNAFHRFGPEACTELRRILKPSGWIALITHTWTNRVMSDRLMAELASRTEVVSRMDRAWRQTPAQALFGAGHIHTRRYSQSRNSDWTTFFGAARGGLEAPVPRDQDFRPFEKLHREFFDAFAVEGTLQIEYETHVMFGRPLAPGSASVGV